MGSQLQKKILGLNVTAGKKMGMILIILGIVESLVVNWSMSKEMVGLNKAKWSQCPLAVLCLFLFSPPSLFLIVSVSLSSLPSVFISCMLSLTRGFVTPTVFVAEPHLFFLV